MRSEFGLCNSNCGNKVIIDDTFDEPYHYVN